MHGGNAGFLANAYLYFFLLISTMTDATVDHCMHENVSQEGVAMCETRCETASVCLGFAYVTL